MASQDLSALLRSLRETAPRLNQLTDDANQAIVGTEKFLRDLSLGIPASTVFFTRDRSEWYGKAERERTHRTYKELAYQRQGDGFRLVVVNGETRDLGTKRETEDVKSVVPLAEASRHDKLNAVAIIPRLLANIVEEATRVQEAAQQAVGIVDRLFGALRAEPVGGPAATPGALPSQKTVDELEKP
jgi:hypothetical protein